MMRSAVVSDKDAKIPPLWNQRTPDPKHRVPVEVSRLELTRRLVAPVVKHDRRAHAVPAIAVNRGHVRAPGAVVLEHLVERGDAHRSDAAGNELADRIFDHRGRHTGTKPEAIRQVCRGVEFAAAHVNGARRRFSKRHDAGIEPVHQGAKGEEIESAFFRYAQRSSHVRRTLCVDSMSCQGTPRRLPEDAPDFPPQT